MQDHISCVLLDLGLANPQRIPFEYPGHLPIKCGVFNDPRDERCPRCGEWKPRGREDQGRDWDDRGRDGDYYGPPRERDDDDYDRRRKKSKHSEQPPRKVEWPPAFEAAGASYIFDARSGMFYEPASDFFYDPKTKLYYSNKRQKYFHFVKGGEPEFQVVEEQQQGAGGVAGGAAVDASQAGVTGNQVNASQPGTIETVNSNGDSKAKIAISLKTTALSSATAAVAPVSAAATKRSKLIEKLRKASSAQASESHNEGAPQVHKQHAKDMDVWSSRVKEMKGEEAPGTAANNTPVLTEQTEVKTTASGQPICVLCRRKFANLEKLQQHEKLSALHKENLARKAAADAAKQMEAATPETTYRDRSKERRLMYSASSADASHVDAMLASVNPVEFSGKKAEVVKPEQTLGDTNVGNQLLQKLGWKNGEALGRKQDGENGAEAKPGSEIANNLKNDWERIESLAQAGGRGRH